MAEKKSQFKEKLSALVNRLTKNGKTRRLWSGVFIFLAFVLVFFAGAISGAAYTNHTDGNGVDMSEFWQVYNLIHQNYVGNVNNNSLIQGAITGMVNGLGDPFSQFLPPADNADLNTELNGQFDGIGAELVDKNNAITIVAPLPNTPAASSGLKPNDIIVDINGKSTSNMSVDTAVNDIRGPQGTAVTLTVLHLGATATTDIKITRAEITVPSVTSKMIGTVGYIQISQFGTDTVDGVSKAVNELNPQNPTALIIDLRNDPGGYLEDVPPIAGEFLPPSVIVQEKYKNGAIDKLNSTSVPAMPTVPIYVLINGGTASAAEILSGALQDYGRATIVGEQSYGKGSVQELINLSGSSALRITIADWLTPKGRTIEYKGITPDVKVTDAPTATTDPVLDKALQLAAQK